MIRVDPSPILFIFYFSYSIRVGPSRSELIRPGLAVRGDPVRLLYLPFEHMAKFNTKSISNWGTFCNFSLAPKRKIYKTSMKHLKIHKFPFKNVIVLAIECKMYLKIQQKLHCLGCISKQTMRSVVKKTRLNSSKDDFLMKSFPSSTKRKLSILLNFLFPFFVF